MATAGSNPVRAAPNGFTFLSDPVDAVVDIVFVHGLQGHPEKTWKFQAPESKAPSQRLAPPPVPIPARRRSWRKLFPSHHNLHTKSESDGSGDHAPSEQESCSNHSKKNVYWPRDLLKDDFPNARIITFGYNTKVANVGGTVNQGNIFDHARTLLHGLEQRRRKAEDRHLVFVAHSLGGILVKEVLRRAEHHTEEAFRRLYSATSGVFFFGTPHRGSGYASIGVNLAALAGKILGVDANSSIVRDLIPDSAMLELSRESFIKQWVSKEPAMIVRTFQEGKCLRGFNELVVTRESSSLDHESQHAMILDADHRDMVRFRGREDPGYDALREDMAQLVDKAVKGEQNRYNDYVLGPRERQCLQMLRTSLYEEGKNRNPDRLDGTCKWVLQHPFFVKWNSVNQVAGLLLVTAGPGCGKSVLSKFLVDVRFQPRGTSRDRIIYFFFREDIEDQSQATSALTALMHQLFSHDKTLIQHAMEAFETEGQQLTSNLNKLWDIFVHATCDPELPKTVCVLDGLDECAEPGRTQLIHFFVELYEDISQGRKPSRLYTLVTSRPYLSIERPFSQFVDQFPEIRLRGEDESPMISSEINVYIAHEIKKLKGELRLNDEETKILQNGMNEVENRTYLWAKLLIDLLHTTVQPTRKKLTSILKDLPDSVDSAYSRILARIDGEHYPIVRKLLAIVVTATRPLTTQELNVALAADLSQTTWADLEASLDDKDRFESSVKHLGGLFVTVVDKKVYLIHQTARQFLLSSNNTIYDRNYHFKTEEAELVLATSCIVVLVLASAQEEQTSFFPYAGLYWISHFIRAETLCPSELFKLAVLVSDPSRSILCEWFKYHLPEDIQRGKKFYPGLGVTADLIKLRLPSPLFVASYLGISTLVKSMLSDASGLHHLKASDKSHGWTPLMWASESGHADVVQQLARANHAVIDVKDKEGDTALSIACMNGHQKSALALLEAGANPCYDEKAKSPSALYQALDNASDEVLQWIVHHTTDATFETLLVQRNIDGNNILHHFSRRSGVFSAHSFEKFFSRLKPLPVRLKNDLLYDTSGARKLNPMHLAIATCDAGLIPYLASLDDNVIDASNRETSRTPLHQAAHQQDAECVGALIKVGANPNLKDRNGRTALRAVAEIWAKSSDVRVFEQLIRVTNPFLKDQDGENILYTVMRTQHSGHYMALSRCLDQSTVQKLFMEYPEQGFKLFHDWRGIATAPTTFSERAALMKHLCSSLIGILSSLEINEAIKILTDQTWILHRLIEFGDKFGDDSLIRKAISALKRISSAFLETKDDEGYTPLKKAVELRQFSTVRILLQHGVEVNAKDSQDQTALEHVLQRDEYWDPEITLWLMEAGASLDWTNNHGLNVLRGLSSQNRCLAAFMNKIGRPHLLPTGNISILSSKYERNRAAVRDEQTTMYNSGVEPSLSRLIRNNKPYLISSPVPANAKLPVLKMCFVIEGWLRKSKVDPQKNLHAEAGFYLAIMRNNQRQKLCWWARFPNEYDMPNRLECTWSADHKSNKCKNFGNRVPEPYSERQPFLYAQKDTPWAITNSVHWHDDDQEEFVREIKIGDRIALYCSSSYERENVTTSAHMDLFYEE